MTRLEKAFTHFIFKEGLYNPKSFEQLCTIQIAKQIETYLDLKTLELPAILKQSIQSIWKDCYLNCNEPLPKGFDYENIDLKHLSKIDVRAIMQIDNAILFRDEDEDEYNILFEYYVVLDDIDDPYFKRICTKCTKDLRQLVTIQINQPSGGMHWSGKRFRRVNGTKVCGTKELLTEVLWNIPCWCDNCAITPLFGVS